MCDQNIPVSNPLTKIHIIIIIIPTPLRHKLHLHTFFNSKVGCLHSLDWTTGLEYWTGLYTGLSYFSFLCTSEQVLPFYLDRQWLMHNVILLVAYCCNCTCSVLIHAVYLLHVYLKAATSIVLLGHFLLTLVLLYRLCLCVYPVVVTLIIGY